MNWRWSALRWLGVILVVVVSFSGTGYCADDAVNLDSVRKDAEQGDVSAQFNLGCMYYEGKGVPVNHQEAMKWYMKAAEQGYADAQFNLGAMYGHGTGVPINYKEAIKWYLKAAEQGEAYAQNNLGHMYSEGKGIPKNNIKAYVWYSLAAAQYEVFKISLERVAKEMTPEQIAEAQKEAAVLWERIQEQKQEKP